MDKHRLPLLAHRVVSLRRRIWSLSGHSGYPAPDTLCRARQSRLQFGAAQSELDANQIEVRFDREEHIRVLHRNREQMDRPVDACKVRFKRSDFGAWDIAMPSWRAALKANRSGLLTGFALPDVLT